MKIFEELLDNYWILKSEDEELYYKIKDNLSEIKEFIKGKLGYKIIVNNLFIKLEKIPGVPCSIYGINKVRVDMIKIEECVEYFKLNNGFDRFMRLLKNNYQKHGYFYGNITLDKVNLAERQALGGFMKEDYNKSSRITINLFKFLRRIKETKYSEFSMEDILTKYFGEEIISEKHIKDNYIKNQERVFEKIIMMQTNNTSYEVVKEILDIYSIYYKVINNFYQKVTNDVFMNTILKICDAINNLPKEKTRLAVFSANITKDPHKFDIKTNTGNIFIIFLSTYSKINVPKNIEQIEELLYINNILIDDVSNMVLTYGLEGYIENEVLHEGLRYFSIKREPIQLTLYNLAKINYIKAKNKKVFVVENPNVFTAIIDSYVLKEKEISIVCTYGQIKLSGLILLDLIKKGGNTIYYSGDMDPEGIIIADKLRSRYNNINYIGLNKECYLKNISNVLISDNRIKSLDRVKSEDLKEIVNLIKQNKKAAYEELNIEYIVEHIKNS